MKKVLIAGNWKMYKTPDEAAAFAEELKTAVGGSNKIGVIICPPFTVLTSVYEIIKNTPIKLGAQNVYWEREGAYTGEISPIMLKELGCSYCIIGHSERRGYFGETDETVNKKITAALELNLIPIMCVGEKLEEKERGETEAVVKKQIEGGLKSLSKESALRLVIAYEPIWAIGTGKTATPKQANEVHKFIRGLLLELYDEEVSQRARILYGGSIKPENSAELFSESDIDGGLIGGASLDINSFVKIIRSVPQ